VFPVMWLDVDYLVGDSSYLSYRAVMSVYGVGSFLHRVDGSCVLLSSVQFSQCLKYRIMCINVCHSYVICLY
jgi:hypothetical protein